MPEPMPATRMGKLEQDLRYVTQLATMPTAPATDPTFQSVSMACCAALSLVVVVYHGARGCWQITCGAYSNNDSDD